MDSDEVSKQNDMYSILMLVTFLPLFLWGIIINIKHLMTGPEGNT